MSYEPTTWKSGDTITSAKLNKLEQGVADASGGGGGALVVTVTESGGEYTMGNTAGEVYAAAQTGLVIVAYDGDYRPLVIASLGKGGYSFSIVNDSNWQPGEFVADTENDYPTTGGR